MVVRSFFIILFFVSLLIAAPDDAVRLEKAKKGLSSNDEIEQFRTYNECKSIYLRASSIKNSPLLTTSLECVANAGELLKIDVTKYKTELAKLTPKPVEQASDIITSAPANAQVETPKPLTFPKEYLKSSTPSATHKIPPFISPSTSELTKSFDVSNPISNEVASKRHKLVTSNVQGENLELSFDTPLEAREVKLSKILEADKQRFRYIVDIESAFIPSTKILEHPKLQKVRLAQYDSKTLRMVIENNEPISIKPIYKGSLLVLELFSNQNTPKTSASSKPEPVIQPPLIKDPPPIVTLPPMLNVTPRDRSKKVIVIDPGHGGKDSGAVGNGYMEKDIVLQISQELAEQLREVGYTVQMTRNNDTFIELKDRTHFANDKSADLFLSIHANSIPKTSDANAAYGIETYFLSPGRSERSMRVAALENSEDMGSMGAYGKLSFLSVLSSEKIIASNKLAIDIQKGVLNSLRKQFPNVKDNGAREAPFWVLVGAQMPAILLEVGYISHPEESSRIADSKYQKWMVEGMVDGVKHYFANNP